MAFDIAQTVQSQYSASPHICALVRGFYKNLDPTADIALFYEKAFSLATAEGVGLDAWGRIVAIPRELVAADASAPYWALAQAGISNPRESNFDNAPFWSAVDGRVRLTDNAYRAYILIKAMANIGDSSLASLNRMLAAMFPAADISLIHVGTMALRLLIRSTFSEADMAALMALPWLPAGVELELYHVVTPTFGFDGSGLQPFGQGTFAYEAPHGAQQEKIA